MQVIKAGRPPAPRQLPGSKSLSKPTDVQASRLHPQAKRLSYVPKRTQTIISTRDNTKKEHLENTINKFLKHTNKEDIEDAARVMWSGGASAMLQRRVDGVAVCVVQFQPIRALQNADGEQEWLLRVVFAGL